MCTTRPAESGCTALRRSWMFGEGDPSLDRSCIPFRNRPLYRSSRAEAPGPLGGGPARRTQAEHRIPNLRQVWESTAASARLINQLTTDSSFHVKHFTVHSAALSFSLAIASSGVGR